MYKVGIITASDKGAAGAREDLSGPAIAEILAKFKAFAVEKTVMLPDERSLLADMLCRMADEDRLDLVLTTGGTGFSRRDNTPEATLDVIERRTPGIPEAMRYVSLQITPRGMLSRAEAGIRGNTLIVNLPGSPRAIRETLEYILPALEHGLEMLLGPGAECARLG
ncbi:MAG: MogA/MoaB family molybdenum cofactor biosynthesis protein [Deltaproteobacteria bacterium]|nr:MogA/MoaB family molybdenum cofactor biosynthesis protein [Deltaproteobacteria bacterium]